VGAAEGVSYLLVIGTVSWSLVTRTRTGRGLPPGMPCPFRNSADGVLDTVS
jgi:hypothetical protein